MSKGINSPPVLFTPEQLLLLEDSFPEFVAYPGVSIDQLMFSGGQRRVVEFIRERTPGASSRDTKRRL